MNSIAHAFLPFVTGERREKRKNENEKKNETGQDRERE
jgi:hypothetical protein